MGSRGIYHDGWMASTMGPRIPWIAKTPDFANWDPNKDEWQLFDITNDFSLMNNLAAENPEKLEEMKKLFLKEAAENKVLPIGGSLYALFNPQDMNLSKNTEWTFFEGITRVPELQAPNLSAGNFRAEIDAEVPKNVSGVLFAMGGYAGGASLYALDGILYYEYSAFMVRRYKIEVGPLPAGDAEIDMEMRTEPSWGGPAELKFWINGKEATTGKLGRTVPGTFTVSETFDVGMDLNSPVADAYFDKGPFPFEGSLKKLHFKYLEQ